jgi:hypothetical protein
MNESIIPFVNVANAPVRNIVTGAAIGMGSIFGVGDVRAVDVPRPVCLVERRAMPTNDTSPVVLVEQASIARQYIADINRLWEPYVMSDEEVTYFRNARAAAFVPLTADQMRILPTRKK